MKSRGVAVVAYAKCGLPLGSAGAFVSDRFVVRRRAHNGRAAYPLRYSSHNISWAKRPALRSEALSLGVTVRKGIALTAVMRYLTVRRYPHRSAPRSRRLELPPRLSRRVFWDTVRCSRPLSRSPNRARRLHYFGESCPVEQISHVCRAGQLLAPISWRNELRASARVRGMLV